MQTLYAPQCIPNLCPILPHSPQFPPILLRPLSCIPPPPVCPSSTENQHVPPFFGWYITIFPLSFPKNHTSSRISPHFFHIAPYFGIVLPQASGSGNFWCLKFSGGPVLNALWPRSLAGNSLWQRTQLEISFSFCPSVKGPVRNERQAQAEVSSGGEPSGEICCVDLWEGGGGGAAGASMWSGCNARLRLQLCLLPAAFIAHCPLAFCRCPSGHQCALVRTLPCPAHSSLHSTPCYC